MNHSIVRISDGLDQYLDEDLLSSDDSLEIHSIEYSTEATEIDGPYYFAGQRKITGSVEYHFEGRKGYSPSRTLQFEYRCESNVFILSSDSTPPELEVVIGKFNTALPSEAQITRIRSADRQSVMNLFQSAHQIKSATFLEKGGPVSLSEVTIQPAGSHEQQRQEVFEAKSNNFNHTIDLEQNPVRSVQGIFRKGSQYVTLEYSKGNFSISHPHSKLGEFNFAIQLIEVHLL